MNTLTFKTINYLRKQLIGCENPLKNSYIQNTIFQLRVFDTCLNINLDKDMDFSIDFSGCDELDIALGIVVARMWMTTILEKNKKPEVEKPEVKKPEVKKPEVEK